MGKATKNNKRKATGRSSRTRPRSGAYGPWRIVARLSAWVLLIVAVLALFVFSWRAVVHVFFVDNPHFTLEHVDTHITGILTHDDVLDILRKRWDITPGKTNLFTIDPGDLRAGLLHHRSGAINYLTVRRKLPDSLQLYIYERQPVAQLGRESPMLVDAEGWVLPPRSTEDDDNRYLKDLPVVVGIRNADEMQPFTVTDDPCLLGMLKFLRLCSANAYGNWLEMVLVQLDYGAEALHVYPAPRGTFAKGAKIIVPIDGMQAAMMRVEEIVRQRTRGRQQTKYIDATYKINVPVRP